LVWNNNNKFGFVARNTGIHKTTKVSLLFVFILGIHGCAVYTVPIDEFDKQTAGATEGKLRKRTVRLSVYGRVRFLTNDIDTIIAYDSNGEITKIPNSPRLEIRFTTIDNSTKTFYFDTIYRVGGILHGSRARLLYFHDSIILDNVSKIEIQDGRKNYSYE
jgi:hypothetical protein